MVYFILRKFEYIFQRGSMVRAARALLSSVTRLLILADMADVYELLRRLKIVQKSVTKVRDSTNPDELLKNFQVNKTAFWCIFLFVGCLLKAIYGLAM